MIPKRIQKLKGPGDRPTWQDWNALVDLVYSMQVHASAPLSLTATPGGYLLSLKVPRTGLKYGKVAAVWDGASDAITLTPCKGATDSTTLTDANGDPLPDVQVNITFPIGSTAGSLPVPVGGILAYETFPDPNADGRTFNLLRSQPEVPSGGDRYDLMQRSDDQGGVMFDEVRLRA